MDKILFFTDVHVKPMNPRSRKDDYYETIKRKLRWVGEYGNSIGVDAFVCGGDLLDRPDATYSTMVDLIDIFKDFNAPIYTVLGNHDIHGYNPDTHKRTALATLTYAGILNRITSEPIRIGETISLTGSDSHYELDRFGDISPYTDIKLIPGRTSVHVVHGFLANKSWPENVPHTLIKDVEKITPANIILAGHEHSGFYELKSGKIFCNPGSLGRVTAGLGDVNLKVKVAIITSDDSSFDVRLEELPEDIARPAEEVLDRALLEEENRREEVMAIVSESTRELTSGMKLVSSDPYGLVSELKKSGIIDEEVSDYMVEKLGEAEASPNK